MSRYKGTLADLVEFGSDEETGAPRIGSLVRALPEDRREAYREERRAFVARQGFRGTFLEYLTQ